MEDWTMFQSLLDNAREIVQVRYVVLSRLDTATGQVRIAALSGSEVPAFQKGQALLARAFPQFDVYQTAFFPDINPHTREVYIEGKVVGATVKELSAGIVNSVVLNAGNMVGFRYGLVCPIKSGDSVAGAISFYSSKPIGDRHREAAILISRQAERMWVSAVAPQQTGAMGASQAESRERTTLPDPPLTRSLSIPRQTIQHGDLTLDPRTRVVTVGNRPVDLTRQEYGILACFLLHPGQAMTA
ncbi:MAG: response regulator transcription factor, partial [SAR202 cluster bacterium]|nr:response regulator transcription factor [SAR202 cluster bacterium]